MADHSDSMTFRELGAQPRGTLVVGGGGFIGEAFLRALLGSPISRRIRVLGRSPSPRYELPASVDYVQGDAACPEVLDAVMEGVDEVVDLAYSTVPKTSFEDPLFDVTANLPASVNLLQMAARRRVSRFLLVSSGGTVYGQSHSALIDESHPTNPISPYGISKLVTEKYARFFEQMYGLPVIIARPSNPFGLNQINNRAQGFVGVAMAHILSGQAITIFGSHGTTRDYLFVDDLADALCSCLDRGWPGQVYNIGTGIGTDNLALVDLIYRLADRDVPPPTIRHEPERQFDVRYNVLDAGKILREIGWVPRTRLAEGIEKMWRHPNLTNSIIDGK